MPFGLSAGAVAAIGAGVSAAAGIGGSLLQAGATKDASGKAIAAQQQALEQSRADLEPWRTAGAGALTGVQNAAGLNGQPGYDAAMAGFHTSPGYQFQLDQGLRAVDAGAASQGLLRSGAALKAEQTFGTGLADKEFTDYYNRLFNLSKMGEEAATGSATASQNTGTGIAQTDLSEGSAMSSIYGNLGKGTGDTVNNLANQSLYGSGGTNRLFGGGGGGTDTTYTNPATGTSYVSSSNRNLNW